MGKSDIGLIGLGVMGRNLAKNWASKGIHVAVHSYEKDEIEQFAAQNPKIAQMVTPCYSLQELVGRLETPAKVLLMVKAGEPVDKVLGDLRELMGSGDIIIDGGNSNYKDTLRRTQQLTKSHIHFVGVGISGGEEGALNGASIMPGGSLDAYERIAPFMESLSIKVDGLPCCGYIGPDGSGHFVKMIHNGIEYADMQLIAETYSLMRAQLNMPVLQIAQWFDKANAGRLESYLIEITAKILRTKDAMSDHYLIDRILDCAAQKGTGMWTAIAGLELAVPIPTLAIAVFERAMSCHKESRHAACEVYGNTNSYHTEASEYWASKLEKALYLCKIAVYAQGFSLIGQASKTYNWRINLARVALLWRGGCIIRAGVLQKVSRSFQDNPALNNLLLSTHLIDDIRNCVQDLRDVVALGVQSGTALPAMSSVLSYFDSFTTETLPANLIQAQRDYFGAHTYQRNDREGQFHTQWDE